MKKKNRLKLPAIMLIFIGIVIIILAILFTIVDPNITKEQVSNIMKLKNI